MVREVAKTGIPLRILDYKQIQRQARLVRSVAEFFKRECDQAEASLGLVVGYGIAELAFNLACAELGMRSADIQHGVQGDLHPVYARWSEVPDSGYALLPSDYLVWSEQEAATIRRWAGRVGGRHEAWVAGNQWLEKWRRSPSLAGQYEEAVREGLRGWDGKIVLLTLQRGMCDSEVIRQFRHLIAATGDWRWLVRNHPMMERVEIDRVREGFGKLANAEIGGVADLPLYGILPHVDVHVTLSSTVVMEAAEFGVPSVVYGTNAARRYQEYTRSGWVRAARDSEQAREALGELMNEGRARKPARSVSSEGVLEILLALVDARRDGQRSR